MRRVILTLTAAIAVIAAICARAAAFEQRMAEHQGGPMTHEYGSRPGLPMNQHGPGGFYGRRGYGAGAYGMGDGEGYGYGYGPQGYGMGGYGGSYDPGVYGSGLYGPAIGPPPVMVDGGGFAPQEDYGGPIMGGGYEGGGAGFQSFHYHTEHYRRVEVHSAIERQATYTPAPIARKRCYHRPRPRIYYARPSCTCCCCGCAEERVAAVRYDPLTDSPADLAPADDRPLTQGDIEFLMGIYKD